MKKTVLYDTHIALGGKMVDFAGFNMPISYSSINEEHKSVRENAGVFDVCHMGEIRITGIDSEKYLEHLLPNRMNTMVDGQIRYAPMCYPNGHSVDDLLVYRMHQEEFLLIVNGSNIEKDYEWMLENSEGFELEIVNQSDSYGLIALQGPESVRILSQLTDYDLQKLKYYYFTDSVTLLDEPVVISRTGYTGEDGFEILGSNQVIKDLFVKLTNLGAKPCGLGARDTLRFEAAMPLYGHELSDEINPLEAGLKYFIDFDKDFIGKKALLEYNKMHDKRKLVGLELLDKGIARSDYTVLSEDHMVIGHITTGYKSPTLNTVLALALIDAAYSALGTNLYVEIRDKLVPAKIINKRFYSRTKN